MIRFSATPTERSVPSLDVLYYDADHAFSVAGVTPRTVGSIFVNSLTLNLDSQGRVTHVDGYAPRESWREGHVPVPSPIAADVAVDVEQLVPGGAVGLTDSPIAWPSTFDPASGWLRVGAQSDRATQFAICTRTVLALESDRLVSIWMEVVTSATDRLAPPRDDQRGA